jgi:hypothetical protein
LKVPGAVPGQRRIKMDFEQYNRMIAAINDQLETIADMTQAQALTGCANEDNPLFKAAMREHKRLTDAAAKLNDQALRALGVNQ